MADSYKGALGVQDFCAAFGIRKTTFYELVKSGKLRAVKCGTRTLVLRSDADAFAASLPELHTVP